MKSHWLVVVALLVAGVGAGWLLAEEPEIRYGVDVRMQRTGPRFDPCAVEGLVGWWRADRGVTSEDGRVTGWADASGHAYAVAPRKDDERPALLPGAVNGLPAVRFGSGPRGGMSFCVLRCGEVSLGEKPKGITLVAVARLHATTFFTPFVTYGDAVMIGQESNTGRLRGTAAGETLVGHGFHVLVATFDADSNQYVGYIDGQKVAESTSVFRSLPAKAWLALGVRAIGENRGLMGDLAEVAVYDRVLAGEKLDGLVRHLLNRYGLDTGQYVTPLATRLPYAYYPSSNEIEVAFDDDAPMLAEYFSQPRAGVAPGNTKPGLAMAFFRTTDQKQNVNLAKDEPNFTGVLTRMEFKHDGEVLDGHGRRPNWVVLKGYIQVPQDGVYLFHVRPWSFTRVQVAGRTVVNTAWRGTFNENSGAIALAKGLHPIVVLSRVHTQPAEFPLEFLWWSRPGQAKTSIPPAALSHGEVSDWQTPDDAPEAPRPVPAELAGIREAAFRVVHLPDGKQVGARHTLKLDSQGRGQARFGMPDLPEGEYALDWLVGGKVIRATVPFVRTRYEWEKNALGQEHKVYPPFEPVKADGKTVRVVDRTYQFNAAGLMDSVVSKGRELLAGPMTLHVVTDGGEVQWRGGKVAAKDAYEDQAFVFGRLQSDALNLDATVVVEEDGAAKVTWSFAPGPKPATIQRMWLDIPLKDAEVPLFHYTGNDSMRHNYAGNTPRGGRIVWEVDKDWGHPVPKWIPTAWRAEKGPQDGVIWDSTKINHWSHGNVDNFCPYVWLGAEERGLAWFGCTDHGYVNDQIQPVQQVIRQGDQVILRVLIIQQPTPSDVARRIVFGLQASPTKPMPADWQGITVPGGGGLAVHPWGGYQCADKYPDNRNYKIVDYIQQVRQTGKKIPGTLEAFDANRLWSDCLVHDDGNWVRDVGYFENNAKNDYDWKRYGGSGVYTEEHAQNLRAPEWQVFQDEWSIYEFNRFADREGNWSQAAESYRDFAVYHNYQWLQRGVSVYFDNCMHRIAYNPYNQGFVGRSMIIWDMREYYKRIWKVLTKINLEHAAPFPVQFTGHVTNTQTIPQNTWMTATLDLEQGYRWDWDRPCQYPGSTQKHYLLPFPADYTRTMTMGRLVGVIPHAMHPLINWGDYREKLRETIPDRVHLADWGMYRVHEVRWGGSISQTAQRLSEYLWAFGYGKPGTRVINYWDEDSPIQLAGGDVKYIAVLRDRQPFAYLVLQSYQEQPARLTVRVPKMGAALDLITHKLADVKDQTLTIDVPGPYGTRVLVLADRPGSLKPDPDDKNVVFAESFEYGIRPPASQTRVWGKQDDEQPGRFAPDTDDPRNTVYQLHASRTGEAAWNLPATGELAELKDHEFSFRFRVPGFAEPNDKRPAQRVVGAYYRAERPWPRSSVGSVRVDVQAGEKPAFAVNLSSSLDGNAVPYENAKVDLRDKPVPGVAVDGKWHRLTVRQAGEHLTVLLDDVVVFDGVNKGCTTGGWRVFNVVEPWMQHVSAPTEIDDIVIRRLP